MSVKSTLSEVLDPEFVKDLQGMSKLFYDRQALADESKWTIAAAVLDMWDEHKSQFQNLDEYYAECSRVMNLGRKRVLFSSSGETLKVYCNVRATYNRFIDRVEDAEKFLDLLSFDHLRRARQVYLNEKAPSPFDALAWAVENSASAEEMQEHFLPKVTPNEYEKATGDIDKMLTKDYWKWLKPDKVKRVIELVAEIRKVIAE